MSNRRFEMYEYRAVLVRMRQGDSDRAIARSGLMGRSKVRRFRALADLHGWLESGNPLPGEEEIMRVAPIRSCPQSTGSSSVEPYRAQVEAGIQYLKRGFVPTREFRSTGEQPLGLFALERRALHYHDPQYRTIKSILEKGLDAEPCGTGKSHIAQAIGHQAVRQEYDVRFFTAANLSGILYAARANGTHAKRFRQMTQIDLLIIDDFGLKPLKSPADEDFHDLIAERYERVTTLVTSNLDFTEWGDAFPNKLLGAATLDRLRHGAYRLTLDGKSYRSPRDVDGFDRHGNPDLALARSDGGGLGEGFGTASFRGQPAIQISRKSNRLNPDTDTAALKLLKVVKWMKSPT